ncbi:MAG: hypothetical protein NZM31_15820 [Gemmatales bacterium]|nr:hypothetical protein [Gemmatales bacterium]MDW8388466.1 hypothetical protein [Gemmatales bacterium]
MKSCFIRVSLALSALLVGLESSTKAAPFTPGHLVVLRVNGTSSAAQSVDLVQFNTFTPGQSGSVIVSLPSSGSGPLLTQSGNNNTQGALTLSADKTHLVLTGFNAPAGTANVAGTSSSSVARVVALVDASRNVNLTTSLNAYSGQSITAAASLTGNPGSGLWTAGTGPGGAGANGIRHTTIGSSGSGTRVVNPGGALQQPRVVQIVNNQLYFSDNDQLRRTNVPLPTTSDVATSNVTTTGLAQARGFVFFDHNNNGVLDTLYVADQVLGLVKFSSEDGVTWTWRGVEVGSFTGITGVYTGGGFELYVTTGNAVTAGNQLRRYVDTAAYNATINTGGTFVTLATAAPGTIFRGVNFTPVPEPQPWGLTASCLGLLFSLQLMRCRLPRHS